MLDKIKICVQHIISDDLITNVKLDGRKIAVQSHSVFEQGSANRGTENVPRIIARV